MLKATPQSVLKTKQGLCKWQVLRTLKVYLYWFYCCYSCATVLLGNTPILPGWKGGFTLKKSNLWTPCGWKLQASQALAEVEGVSFSY